jgi:formylglycine-generating enzyme required for sulfatase activity
MVKKNPAIILILLFFMVAHLNAALPPNFLKLENGECPTIAENKKSSEKKKTAKVSGKENASNSLQAHMAVFNPDAMERAIKDMAATWPDLFKDADALLKKVNQYRSLKNNPSKAEGILAFQREVLTRNPLLDFNQLLYVRRDSKSFGKCLPANWQSNSSIPKKGYDNEIAVLSIKEPTQTKSLYRPAGGAFVGDVDLHFDADKMLFSTIGDNGAWQIFEAGIDGQHVRQVTHTKEAHVNNYDSCYLPNGRILFTSTAPMVAVPCVDGKSPVATLFIADADGQNMRQLCFDQEHSWNPQVMADGRILYLRWEYVDLPHSNSRILFTMNPDGTNQRAIYGSNSWWPNSYFYARQIPGSPENIIGIVSGHHGKTRTGELVLLDTSKGTQEADGVVQSIPGFGKKVKPRIADGLVNKSFPQFLHPYPLSDKYFLVSAEIAIGDWGIYLVDVFDNMTLIKSEPGYALLEPVPLRKTKRPPVLVDKVDLSRKDSTISISDIYEGPGLDGIPRGTVKNLRVYTYTFGYNQIGGLLGTIGADGPWDMRRILGTVPVESDGSAVFKVPANTPITLQPLDSEGKALQVMRSWFTAMPGENLSCVGCHEPANAAPPMHRTIASGKSPSAIQPWRGPARNFGFAREVQPVLDRHCVGCHTGEPHDDGKKLPSLRGDRFVEFVSKAKGSGRGAHFSEAYVSLHGHLRRPGEESGMRLHSPMEFHADSTELFMMLNNGHHGVELDAEAKDRLVTWYDLNAPYFGRWSDFGHTPATGKEEERARMRALYANVDENHEYIKEAPLPKVEFIKPKPMPPVVEEKVSCNVKGTISGKTQALDLGNGVSLKLVHVPAGELAKGSKVEKIQEGFWMGCFEITNEQFRQFDPAHDSKEEPRHGYQFGVTGYPANAATQPAIRLSWNQAAEFCKWLSEKSGKKVSLPTETQWEWACRAGATTPFSFGELGTDFTKHANLADVTLLQFIADPYVQDPVAGLARALIKFKKLAGSHNDWIPRSNLNDGGFISEPVGKYQPNAWGLYDMHGNVAEWTASEEGSKQMVRGGSWYDRPQHATATFRRPYRDYQRVYNVGFRIIVEDGLVVVDGVQFVPALKETDTGIAEIAEKAEKAKAEKPVKGSAQTSENKPWIKDFFENTPSADTNEDGILTLEEVSRFKESRKN